MMSSNLDLMPDRCPGSHPTKAIPLSKAAKKNKKRNERRSRRPREMQQKTDTLPVKNYEKEIANTVKNNQVVIITAETGCGKSSQVPQILLRDVLRNKGIVVCTQPRRVAASSLASRVAEEMNVEVGDKVGYHVRFDNITSSRTQIKYMTDGILLRECLFNTNVVENNYSIIVIDEVHERSIQMDLLFGFMKMMLPKLEKLKLVIMSATMNTESVSKFFSDAPVLRLKGTLSHSITNCYVPGFTNDHILKVITRILDTSKDGDILVFLPGEPEIRQLETALGKLGRHLCILPAHSQMPNWKVDRIFGDAPKGQRKIILSTNLAESSITLKDLKFVVDTGYVNVKVFDGTTGISQLETRLISKSEAQQRRGRVGRTGPGFCYRLYKKEQLHCSEEQRASPNEQEKSGTERCFQDFPAPQIERDDLTHLVLVIKTQQFTHVRDFPWLTPPKQANVAAAEEDLIRLEALDSTSRQLTEKGRHMVKFPLHPRLTAAILSSEGLRQHGALLFAAILSAFNGGRQRSLTKLSRSKYAQESDEATVLIHIMHEFVILENEDEEDGSKVQQFASEYNIGAYNIYEAVHVYKQLSRVLKTCGDDHQDPQTISQPDQLVEASDIREVLTRVFASNIGERNNAEFTIPSGRSVQFRPTLPSRASRGALMSVGGTELFRLADVREQRRDEQTRFINTFVPTTQNVPQ